MRETVPKSVQDCHDLLRWLIPHLGKFPRARRFTLGERLEGGLLDVPAELIDAVCRRDKPRVRSANRNRNDTGNRNNNLGFRLVQSTRASPEPARPRMRRARRAGVHEPASRPRREGSDE